VTEYQWQYMSRQMKTREWKLGVGPEVETSLDDVALSDEWRHEDGGSLFNNGLSTVQVMSH
jgi:hypothetical protein